jgi:dCMP deaminase
MKGTLILSSKWDLRYLALAEQVSTWSKDPSRQIGAVAVGSKGQVLAQGYNGFPRGIQDNHSRYSDRDLKYKLVVHAEMNVIYNATYNGVSLNDSTLYVHGLPVCSDCAKGIIQVGIKRVVMPTQEVPDHWKESWEFTQGMFKEAGVNYEFI